MSVSKLPNGRWRVQIRRKGVPRVDQVFATREEAERADQAAQAALLPRTPDGKLSLAEAWERYSDSTLFLDKAATTRATEESRIKPILERLGGYSLARLYEEPRLIREYQDVRARSISPKTKKPLSKTSVRLEVAALAAVCEWAVQYDHLLQNPTRLVRRPGQSRRNRRLQPTEAVRLAQASSQKQDARLAEDARFAQLLCILGCRPGELAKLRRQDVELTRRQLTFLDTKNGSDRTCHLVEDAISMLDVQLAHAREAAPDSPWVFSTYSRKQKAWVKYNFSGSIGRLRETGVVQPSFHAHCMRREFISRAIEAGLPLTTIKKQSGHRSVQALEIYDNSDPTAPDVRAALDVHAETVRSERSRMIIAEGLLAAGATTEQVRAWMSELEGKKTSGVSMVLSSGEVVPLESKAGKRR